MRSKENFPVKINPYAKHISTQYSCQNLIEITKEYSTVGIQYSMSTEVLNVVDKFLERQTEDLRQTSLVLFGY